MKVNGHGSREWVSVTREYLDELYDTISSQRLTILNVIQGQIETAKVLKETHEVLQGVIRVQPEDRLLHARARLADVVPIPHRPGCPPEDAVDEALGDVVLG